MSEDADAALQRRETIEVTLEVPIRRGEQLITSTTLRRPLGGALRGVSIVGLGQLDYDELEKVIPRISTPPLFKTDLAVMGADDLLSLGAAVGSFLLNTGDLSPTA